MSSCPNKDIHSLYLDNEIPDAYRTEYEAHIASCPKCAATLAQMQSMSALLKAEDTEFRFDETDKTAGYERLLIQMRYHKTAKAAARLSDSSLKYIFPAAAAAAAFAVFFPLQLSGGGTRQTQTALATPITRAAPVFVAAKDLVINGTIRHRDIGATAPLAIPAARLDFTDSSMMRHSRGTMPSLARAVSRAAQGQAVPYDFGLTSTLYRHGDGATAFVPHGVAITPPFAVPTSAVSDESTTALFTNVDLFIPQQLTENDRHIVLKVAVSDTDSATAVWTFALMADDRQHQ
ncbi:MAG: zf-HC2 domain-containing protein [Treponema sp.]|nr:zf-HC2 domain-containing protein [Treponema sp.]